MMKYIVLAVALFAVVSAEDWSALNLDDESEARLLFNTNSSGNSLIPDARAVLGFILVGVLLVSLLGLSGLGLPVERGYDTYDYNYYNQYQDSQYQQQDAFSARYGISSLASKMHQLETAFKKFEVQAEECQMFIACEAAQTHKLKTNVPIVQIVNRILSTPGNEDKINPNVQAAFLKGREQLRQPQACAELRSACYAAHNQYQ